MAGLTGERVLNLTRIHLMTVQTGRQTVLLNPAPWEAGLSQPWGWGKRVLGTPLLVLGVGPVGEPPVCLGWAHPKHKSRIRQAMPSPRKIFPLEKRGIGPPAQSQF